MLDICKISLEYPCHKIIEDLSFHVYSGEIIGILGKNGIGKTTLLNAMVGLKRLSSGTIESHDNLIGYLPENSDTYEYLTGRELLQVVAELKNIKMDMVQQLLSEMSSFIFLPKLDELISSYSKGNKEKLLFVLSLLGEPDILIMDEPFTGFDPDSFLGGKRYLAKYVKKGHAVIFSTHIIEMAAQLCSRIIILKSKKDMVVVELKEKVSFTTRVSILEQYFNELS